MHNVCDATKESCTGCGLCESICPIGAIQVKEKNGFLRPQIDSSCVDCGKCVRYCPGISRMDDYITHHDFRTKIYGHSTSEKVREEAASGAITTELLKYVLDSGMVDYVITSDVYCYDRNLGYAIITKDNAEQLYNYSGSNYCPANIGRAIKEIKSREGVCAIVCLPCLSAGIKLLRQNDMDLNNKIKFVISLMCNHVPSYEATDYIIAKYKIDSPAMIKYRGKGWFGYLRTFDSVENGIENFSIPYSEYFGSKYSEYFWQKGCIECKDHFGIYSDLVVGDADFVKYREPNLDNLGETICFSNNEEMISILNQMDKEQIICLKDDIDSDELDLIYGPLADTNRAGEKNLRCGYCKVLREERLGIIKRKMGTFLAYPYRIIVKLGRMVHHGK